MAARIRVGAMGVGLALIVGLAHAQTRAPDASATVGAAGIALAPSTVPAPTTSAGPLYRNRPVAEILSDLAQRPAAAVLHRFSSTTAVYHLDLGGGIEAAFKPATRRFPVLWHNDVAGWRLARLLSLGDRAPPAVARRLPLALFGRHAARDQLLPSRENPNEVWGAMIYWLPTLGHTSLHTPEATERWTHWLEAGARTRGRTDETAEQLSSLLLFDYLQANEDRWNAGNLRTDEHGTLLLRDNNGGWWSALMSNPETGAWRLRQSQRFRRDVFEALERATGDALSAELRQDPNAMPPLMSPRVLGMYERRRRTAVAWIRACIRRYGEPRVLAW